VLYSFCRLQNCTDGATPEDGLIDVKGMLYGTTVAGGNSGCGTVFSVDARTGTEAVVYSFCSRQNCTDGEAPAASLLEVNEELYGTTVLGGTYGSGTVFALEPQIGKETVIHSFGSGTDGEDPEADLVDVNGTLYGTTASGGAHGEGTVFSVTP
jgi:uncharacterized repeat protein (TIGR03803 family)